ncbi:hypothetical protein [Paenibacillus cymbidii]|uniref:hypothetical protein n=1 Tax=Paenibacillus cymbidii TaxID=1639034 RepID=UPI00108016D6|nr:hypothetical protein [Paenibacillus cymbidii]
MRFIKYGLLPEAYGSDSKFIKKEGSVTDLILDTGMLIGSEFDKVIPPLSVLNRMFLKGFYPRTGEWEPFDISQEEYNELIKELVSLPLARPYRTIDHT